MVRQHVDRPGGCLCRPHRGTIGVLNGVLVTKIGINWIIATLGTLAIFRGLTRLVSDGATLRVDGFEGLGRTEIFGEIPVPVVIFVASGDRRRRHLPIHGLRSQHPGGRLEYGGRPASGRQRCEGSVHRIRHGRAVCSPRRADERVSAGSRIVERIPRRGARCHHRGDHRWHELLGRRGTIVGTVLGLSILATLNNGLVLVGVSPFWQEVSRGIALIVAVTLDRLRFASRRRRSRMAQSSTPRENSPGLGGPRARGGRREQAIRRRAGTRSGDIAFPRRTVTAIVGDNGAGKSTLMKIFAGAHATL